MRLLGFLLLPLSLVAQMPAPARYSLSSPSGLLELQIESAPVLRWQLLHRGRALTEWAPLALELEEGGVLGGAGTVIERQETRSIDRVHRPTVRQKNAVVPEHGRELVLHGRGGWGVAFRAYDDGAAYRFFVDSKKSIAVLGETYELRPAGADTIYYPEEQSFYSHNERRFTPRLPASIRPSNLASLPALVHYASGVHLLLTETDLRDYPGLWLRGHETVAGAVRGVWPARAKYTVELTRRDIQPTDREAALARTQGPRTFPWRLFLVADSAAALLTNQLPWLLAEPSRLRDESWIRPGKVAWDWWNNLNLYGVDFRAGINTATYKYFVDFAARNQLEYVVLDEGWSQPGELLNVEPLLDMDSLAAYARARGVGLILWVTWSTLDKQFDALLPDLKRWDIKGLKVDFMQRDDQDVVNYYWRMAEKAAAHRLLLDFHGAHKPAGLHRTWPNVLTFEGVYGLENSKWDPGKSIDPEHNVTLPFTRMVAGPMDYTPGAMLNAQRGDWAPSWNRPQSLGTRCHELAKYVVYESPLQMLSDAPTNYEREPECLAWLRDVPAVWDTTIALAGRVGDYVAVARRAADGSWYAGAMTDWTPRTLALRTDFLPAGEYVFERFDDGVNADRYAGDYKRTELRFTAGETLQVRLAPGGGFVGRWRRL
jgi:alpha-glucosidase